MGDVNIGDKEEAEGEERTGPRPQRAESGSSLRSSADSGGGASAQVGRPMFM